MQFSFGSKELIKCLQYLNFKKGKSVGSSHLKYFTNKNVSAGFRPFIIVLLDRKVYDPNTQHSYISQIKKFGYSIEEIKKGFGIKY